MNTYQLYGRHGWGSVLVESQLVWYGLPFDFIEVDDLFTSEAARKQLAKVNPLAQIPTLVLPDTAVMTESAAITLYLADVANASQEAPLLVPTSPGSQRNSFLRWLIYLVANVYPTYTYADDPSRFVTVEAAQEPFKASVRAYSKRLYGELERVAGTPWFLGGRFSALDLYVCTLTHWEPGLNWFKSNAPSLYAIAERAMAQTRLQDVWERNFKRKSN